MAIVVKPTVKVDTIEIKKDENNPDSTRNILLTWGKTMPIVKIGDYVLSTGELISYEFGTTINSLPFFTMEIDDSNYTIRKLFKKQIDKCCIFIGYDKWYIKYNGLITSTYSDDGEPTIQANGILFNQALYNSVQKSYVNTSVQDILKDIAEQSKMGLFTLANAELEKKPEYCINPNMRLLEFFNYCIRKYTDNIWLIDPNYYMYVGNIETARKQKVDKYTLNQNGESIEPTDICITTSPFFLPETASESEKKKDELKIRANYYTVDTNFSNVWYKASAKYTVNNKELKSDASIGISDSSASCFPGFETQYFPFYIDRVNKQLTGTIIKVSLKNIIYEITPFSVVNFEAFMPRTGVEPIQMSKEHSGKKVVIGYRYKFDKKDTSNEVQSITQYLDLI